jgi:hypothetical protein
VAQLKALEEAVAIAGGLQSGVAEPLGDPGGGLVEFGAWRFPAARRVVGQGAELGAEGGLGDQGKGAVLGRGSRAPRCADGVRLGGERGRQRGGEREQ